MRQHEALRPGLGGDLGGLARRRMSGLDRALCFLLGERRFVDQEIGIAGRVDRRGAWPRVAGHGDPAASPRRPDELRWMHDTAVVERYRQPAMDLSPERT